MLKTHTTKATKALPVLDKPIKSKGKRGKKLYLCGQYKSGLSPNSLVWEFQSVGISRGIVTIHIFPLKM